MLTPELALVLMSRVALMVDGLAKYLNVSVILDIIISLRMVDKSVKVAITYLLAKTHCDIIHSLCL